MKPKTFAIVGGDRRNIELSRLLNKQGHTVKLFGFVNYEGETPMQCSSLEEVVAEADCVIGPIPCSHNNVTLNAPFLAAPIHADELFQLMQPHQAFLAGVINPKLKETAERRGIEVIDMLTREELLVMNAIPTAEGAIKIAIDETDITLHGNLMMVIGYGRIGKILSAMLRGIGARVLAVVNSEEAAALAEASGHTSVMHTEMESRLKDAAVIFNTVPEILLDKTNMRHIRKNTLIVDLASPPYGVDANDSRNFGFKVLFTNSLPGKVAPVTTAKYILKTVVSILNEKGGSQDETGK